MKKLFAAGLLVVHAAARFSAAEAGVRVDQIQFAKGASGAAVTGKIAGDETVDYRLRAGAGQTLVVVFKPNNPSAYFNVLPPGSNEAIFIGSTSGYHAEAELVTAGVYSIRVYLMRNAARRKETAKYTLEVRVTGGGKKTAAISERSLDTPVPFDKTLELQGIQFHVTSTIERSGSTVRIVPAGLAIDNAPVERTIEGTITGAEVADLNVDGSPEIYVYVTSTDRAARGSLVAYSANKRKSLSEIYLPPIGDDRAASEGYRGHDAFGVVESVLARRFPIYRDTETGSKPTGRTRQLQYKLVPGEAGWRLEVDRRVEY